ncbi:MAG: hypothetical protein CMH57_15220 [Myxococcales bacterium]|nr:hypothetical protein [Myxococcales bacterium]
MSTPEGDKPTAEPVGDVEEPTTAPSAPSSAASPDEARSRRRSDSRKRSRSSRSGASRRSKLLPKNFLARGVAEGADLTDALDVASHERRNHQHERRRNWEARRQRRQRAERRRELLTTASQRLMIAAVFAAPLAIGTVHLATAALVALLATLSAAMTIGLCHARQERVRPGLAGWTLLALSGAAFLHALPLPTGLVSVLGGSIGGWLEFAYGSVEGGAPGWSTMGLAPGYAVQSGLGLLAAAGVYLTASHQFREQRPFLGAMWIAPWLGVTLVGLGLVQLALRSPARLLFYTPRHMDTIPLMASSFVNPEHLGVLLASLTLIPMGMSQQTNQNPWRGTQMLMLVMCSAGLVATLSLSAVLAWVFGLLVFGGLTLRDRLHWGKAQSAALLGGLAAVGVALVGAWTALGPKLTLLDRLRGVSWSDPWPVWSQGLGVLTEVFWVGTGPGGYSDAAAAASEGVATTIGRHTFVGNGYLQAALDFGAPLGLAAAALLIAAVVRVTLRSWRKPTDLPLMRALTAALAAAGLGAATGFGASIPGVYVPGVMLLGLMVGRDRRYRGIKRFEPASMVERAQGWAPATCLGALVALAALLGPAAWSDASGEPAQAVRTLAASPAPLPEEVEAAARRALVRRPLQGRLHLMIGLAHRAAGDDALALAALERAARFEPGDPAPTTLIARTHLERGRKAEALRTYRDALLRSQTTQGAGRLAIAAELGRVLKTPADLLEVVPPTDHEVWSVVLRGLLSPGQATPERATLLVETAQALLKRNPSPEVARLAKLHLARGRLALGQEEEAREVIEALLKDGEAPSGAYQRAVQLQRQRGELLNAIATAEEGLDRDGQHVELQFLLAELLLDAQQLLPQESQTHDWQGRMKELLVDLRTHALRHDGPRYRFYMLAGQHQMGTGQHPLAIRDLKRAAEASPGSSKPLELMVGLLQQERRNGEALKLYEELIEGWPDHPERARWEHEAELLRLSREELRERFNWTPDDLE